MQSKNNEEVCDCGDWSRDTGDSILEFKSNCKICHGTGKKPSELSKEEIEAIERRLPMPVKEYGSGKKPEGDMSEDYKTSDYRAKKIMEDFARQVDRHGFSASGNLDAFIRSIINWKNDCLSAKTSAGSVEDVTDNFMFNSILAVTKDLDMADKIFKLVQSNLKMPEREKLAKAFQKVADEFGIDYNSTNIEIADAILNHGTVEKGEG